MITIPKNAVVLGLAKKKDEAVAAAKELERIGVHAGIYYNIVSDFQRFVPASSFSSDFLQKKPESLSCLLGHYHIVQAALDFGLDSLWVVEDDTRFLKDVARVRQALDTVPADADFLVLDGIVTPESWSLMPRPLVPGWIHVTPSIDVRSTGNYILNRRAMTAYRNHLAGLGTGKLPVAPDCGRNERDLPGVKVYMSYPLLSIQRPPDGSRRGTCQWSDCLWHYRRMRIAPDAYA